MDRMRMRPARVGRMAAFLGFFTTLVIYSPNVMALGGFDAHAYTGYFAEPCLITAFLTSGIVAALSLRGKDIVRWGGGKRMTLLPCASILYLVGNGGYALVTFLQPELGVPLNIAFALCAGIGVVPVCMAWAHAFGDLDLVRSVLAVACAGGCSVLCNMALSGAPVPVAAAAYLVLLGAGTAWPLGKVLRSGPADEPEHGACRHVAGAADPRCIDVRAFLSVMGVPLLGMAIASFAMGVQPVTLFGGAVDAQHLGMLIGAAALVPLVRFGRNQPMYSFVYQLYLPGCAALALVLCAFPGNTWIRDVALAVVYAFYAMVCGVAIAAAIAIANAREFPRGFVFATLVGAFCGMAIFGIFLGARVRGLTDNNASVLIVLTALYGGWLLFSGCLASWRLTVGEAHADMREGGPADKCAPRGETFEARVARLTDEAGLSPRETEIFGYIGRGHSSVYVAKTLLISESTVYSHVRNIYRKLGLTSREELIQLLTASGVFASEAIRRST